jgi:hypothetical protein
VSTVHFKPAHEENGVRYRSMNEGKSRAERRNWFRVRATRRARGAFGPNQRARIFARRERAEANLTTDFDMKWKGERPKVVAK